MKKKKFMFPKEKYINFILQNITKKKFFKHFIDL